ncbi:MAG: hypothetical protein UX31_C0001G0008 [Candidatus Nomurabacteria bacterium GW2011_GWA1_46_11]|uniref:DUF5671 domain-containing protein n=2 Tax=Parcubacteria group TaxID=1794811 RepID=A0A1F8EYV4_9BACT|nr:MAG: hypothetical protein UX31_C0001G0008 [Candidatus Nomurabacteria bacterium GW2011_GWA1_46_11]OGN06041.1 MAG: hypothetical protein A2669_00730 [Candidatus Yanofskybacteria bacterium RIFCSPHIGHO2_01_FULL_48_25b]
MNTSIESGGSTARDTFLYLLSLITLVASAVSFGVLIYQFIDIAFPDALQSGYRAFNVSYDTIRMAIAALIVVFPVFFWTNVVLHRDVVSDPEKRNLRIRRWLLYFTIFVAGLVMIGDLVTLINNFLSGDLTRAFILKVITIFFIAGSTFFYYLSELKNRSYPRQAFRSVIIAVIALALGYGFYVAGSPQNQRLVRFDNQKINDLQIIQSQLVYYWQQKGSLPTNLEGLNDPISGFIMPKDPQTGEMYGYHLKANRSFELCANFNKENKDDYIMPHTGYPATNWQHGAGPTCFERTIDQTLYPIKRPVGSDL